MGYFLKSKNLGLRTLEDSDIDGNYIQWFNDPIVCQYNSHHKYMETREKLKEYISEVNNNPNTIVFAIVDLKSSTHIGNISLQEIDYVNRSAELSFIIGEVDFWSKGYATEAGKLVIQHAFEELNLHRIYLGTADNNLGMQKVASKLGFIREGVRKDALYNQGQYHDIIEYGKIRCY